MKIHLGLRWLCYHRPKYLKHQLDGQKASCVEEMHISQPKKERNKKMSPSSWSAAHKPLPATLLHLSSVPCLKFVMREKVIFTAGCVRDLFKAFVRGSLSMQLLRLSAATESKGNTVDAVIARRCPQKELSLNWISLSPSVGEKQNLLLVLC